METQILDSKWILSAVDPEYASKHCPYFAHMNSLEMSIPGEVHSTLLSYNLIPNPYYGKNELDTLWIGKSDWKIETYFNFKKKSGRTVIPFTRVDTICKVILNDNVVASTDNVFARYIVDVTDYLIDGENHLELIFTSAEKVALERSKQLPYPFPYSTYPNSSPNRNLVRKTQCHSGTDFGPCIMAIGVYDPIKLVTSDTMFVKSWNCVPRLLDHNWICKVEVTANVYKECDVELSIQVAHVNEKTITHVKPGQEYYSFTFAVAEEDVELWYPAGQGGQHLYPLDISFGLFQDKRMIAFRTIAINEDRLSINVNGKDIFIKGINWVPMDAIQTRNTVTKYIRLLQAVTDANMNMVRVWGGGFYENEPFYDTCDRLGILVWHDLMFSSSTYPSQEWFLKSIEKELKYQIPRLKSHASIALWCGNNEGFDALSWYEESIKSRDRYVMDYTMLNEGVCARLIKSLDPSRLFWPSTPSHKDDQNGDIHCWDVWNNGLPFEEYKKLTPRFCTEYGYQSFPSLSTVKEYTPDSDLNITSPVMEHHQKCVKGNSTILNSFSHYFRFPTSFEKMLYLSQVQQAYAMQIASEYWRSKRPDCKGALIWNLNDNWPVTSYSAIEYSGKWKLLMYHAKNFFAPISPIAYVDGDKLKVFATNDTDNKEDVKVSVKFSTFKGEKIERLVFNLTLDEQGVTNITEIDISAFKKSNTYAYVKLSSSHIYRETTIFLIEPKRCELQDPQLSYDVKQIGRNFQITLTSKRPAFFVSLDQGDVKGTFSENMFTLRPTASHLVQFTPDKDEDVSLESFKEKLKVFDLYTSGN